MSDLEETIKIDKLVRTVEKKRSSEQFLDLGLTATASASITALADATSVIFTMTTEHDADLRIFATVHLSIYEGSVSAANKIQGGSNIGNTDYEMTIWPDWGATNNKNVVHRVWVLNNTGGSKDILLRVNTRFIVETATSGAGT